MKTPRIIACAQILIDNGERIDNYLVEPKQLKILQDYKEAHAGFEITVLNPRPELKSAQELIEIWKES